MKTTTYIRGLIALAFVLISLFTYACQDPIPDPNNPASSSGDKGKLRLVLGINQSDYDVINVKGKSLNASADDLTVIINQGSNQVDSFPNFSDIPNGEVELDPGDYTIIAHSDENPDAAFESPYYYGESDFEIEDDVTVQVPVTATMANTYVAVGYTDEFDSLFTNKEVKVSTTLPASLDFIGDETRRGSFRQNDSKTFDLIVEATADFRSSGDKALGRDTILDFDIKTQYNFTFDYDAKGKGKISITIDTTVTHVHDTIVLQKSQVLEYGSGWEEVTSAADWPARAGHTALSYNDTIWIFGGTDNSVRGDVWKSYDGDSWEEVTAYVDYGSRSEHLSLVFNNKMWVIGGLGNSNNYPQSVWSSTDGENWTEETSSAPWSGRNGHSGFVHNGEMWIMGGYDGSTFYNDVWHSADGTNWTEATDSAGWDPRWRLAAFSYDNKMWVAGGGNYSDGFDDVWVSSDGATWTEVTQHSSNPMGERYSPSYVVYDNKMWLIGGSISGSGPNRIDIVSYSTDGAEWIEYTKDAANHWTGRILGASIVHDNNIWLFGGLDNNQKRNDVWVTKK